MKNNDLNFLYGWSFMKELNSLFRDKANMKSFERRYNLKTVVFPQKQRAEALSACSDWLFDHFLFSVSEKFLDDKVEFSLSKIVKIVAKKKKQDEEIKKKYIVKTVVSVSNGIIRYEFLIDYRNGLIVKHRIVELEDAA